MRFARLTATLALIALFSALVIVLNHNTSTGTTTATIATPLNTNVNLYKMFNWQREWKIRRLQAEAAAAAAAKAAAEKAAADKAAAERAATQRTRTQSTRRVVQGSNNGDFASCVRGKESTNNYAYSGYYHGAYNMTLSHWDNYHGYSSPESAPPEVQDAKFQSDVAQGSTYMHQQYPSSSRACGM